VAGDLHGLGDSASQEQSDQGNTRKYFVEYPLHGFEMSARGQDVIDDSYRPRHRFNESLVDLIPLIEFIWTGPRSCYAMRSIVTFGLND
jgi:hypothetical protein